MWVLLTLELRVQANVRRTEGRRAEPGGVVVHCKAGKGRTGVMACCLLMHLGYHKTAAESIAYYNHRRTKDGKGLTVPSQRRCAAASVVRPPLLQRAVSTRARVRVATATCTTTSAP